MNPGGAGGFIFHAPFGCIIVFIKYRVNQHTPKCARFKRRLNDADDDTPQATSVQAPKNRTRRQQRLPKQPVVQVRQRRERQGPARHRTTGFRFTSFHISHNTHLLMSIITGILSLLILLWVLY